MTQLIAPRMMKLQKEAMLEKNKVKVSTLRLLASAIKQLQVDEQLEALTLDQEQKIIKKMIKQRNDSVEQYTKANREDLADVERQEILVLEEHLLKQMTDEEMEAEVDRVIATFDAPTKQDMGKVMGQLKSLGARADMGKISGMVRSKL